MLNNQNNNPIAFFDSGVGGLTVFEKVQKLLPDEDYIYFGDTKNVPYGEKTKTELLQIAEKVFEFLATKKVKAVVLACNTTSSTIYEEIKNKYPFKVYPIIQSVAKIIAEMPVKRLGVFATAATIKSGAYEREIKKYNPNIEVFSQACPEWVKIVEENKLGEDASKELVKKYLDKMLANNVDKIILGCTHYPYLINILKEFAPEKMFIDPSGYFAQFIAKDLTRRESAAGAFAPQFYATADVQSFKNAAKMFYELKTTPTFVSF